MDVNQRQSNFRLVYFMRQILGIEAEKVMAITLINKRAVSLSHTHTHASAMPTSSDLRCLFRHTNVDALVNAIDWDRLQRDVQWMAYTP